MTGRSRRRSRSASGPPQGKTAESYIRRLARANHLRPSLLPPSGLAGAIDLTVFI